MKITDFINGEAYYDSQDQEIYIYGHDNSIQKFLQLRGWGKIQNMFMNNKGEVDFKSASKFQDEIGKFVEDAINEKLKRESNQLHEQLHEQLEESLKKLSDDEFNKLLNECSEVGCDCPVYIILNNNENERK